MMLRRSLPTLTLLLITAIACPAVYGGHFEKSVSPVDGFTRVAERTVSLRQAVNLVRQQTGGRVLDAQDQGTHYRIKVLTPEGEVRIYRVDAGTGAIR
ncbi:MAG: hypothetical protein GTO41_10705 [Burkholderiales bacterium]|nr:hypothetical protein [Burkholderiales bacterium]